MRDDVQIGPTPGLVMAILPLLATTAILILQFFVFSDFTPHPIGFRHYDLRALWAHSRRTLAKNGKLDA